MPKKSSAKKTAPQNQSTQSDVIFDEIITLEKPDTAQALPMVVEEKVVKKADDEDNPYRELYAIPGFTNVSFDKTHVYATFEVNFGKDKETGEDRIVGYHSQTPRKFPNAKPERWPAMVIQQIVNWKNDLRL